MRMLRQGQVYSFGAYMKCRAFAAHQDAGNGAEVIRTGVRAALARLGEVARCADQFAVNALGSDKCGWDIQLTPAADTNTDVVGRTLLAGANAHAGGVPTDGQWTGQNALVSWQTMTVVLTSLFGQSDGWRESGQYVVDEDSVVAGAQTRDPVTSASTAGRLANATARDETGASLAGQNAAKLAAGAGASWLTPVLIGVGVIAGLVAVGYALRPVVDLVEEL